MCIKVAGVMALNETATDIRVGRRIASHQANELFDVFYSSNLRATVLSV